MCRVFRTVFLAFIAAIGPGLWALPQPVSAQQGITCALLEAEMEELSVAYARVLADLIAAAEALDSATAERRRLLDQASGAGIGDGSDTSPIAFVEVFVTLDGLSDIEAREDAALAAGAAARAEMRLINRLALAMVPVLEQACSAEGTDQTVAQTQGGDATATASGTGSSGSGGGLMLLTGHYTDNNGNYAYFDGTNFRRDDGSIRVTISCGGQGSVEGISQTGTVCTGRWFDRDGNVGGYYEGVVFRWADSSLPRIHGLYHVQEATRLWRFGLSFGRFTDEEAAEAGLTVPDF